MFYKKGIDITNDRQMFEFLKGHYTYDTLNSWNGATSIANKVKMYTLHLSGDWCTALQLLENGEYDAIQYMIEDWCYEHEGFSVYFNGRSNGYLVLTRSGSVASILPYAIDNFDTYEDFKEYVREDYGSVKAYRDELRFYTQLVQDFDKLCDDIRDFCDELSNIKFEVAEMRKSVDEFNFRYEDDLELLGFAPLKCSDDGKVNVSEIMTFSCLSEAFLSIASRRDSGYDFVFDENGLISLESKY